MLPVQSVFRVPLLFLLGLPLAEYAQSTTVLQAVLGGNVIFRRDGATAIQCKTYGGRFVQCDSEGMEGFGPRYKDRVSGSCDAITLEPVEKEDLDQPIVCEHLDKKNSPEYVYKINAITAPPQNMNVYVNVNESGVTVHWQPPPAHLRTGPILEYEFIQHNSTAEIVNCSCSGIEPLMRRVANTSIVLEGLPPGTSCRVCVAVVSLARVGAQSEHKHFVTPTKEERHGLHMSAVTTSAVPMSGGPPIVWILVPVAVGVGVVCLIGYFIWRYKKNKKSNLESRTQEIELSERLKSKEEA